jgi:GNAT superfamily N-acetyltransferase
MNSLPADVQIRLIRPDELSQLLALYRHLHPEDPELVAGPELDQLWRTICADPKLHYFVAKAGGLLVSTCTLSIIPNLTRGAKPYGLIENVVTHPDYRSRGISSAVLHEALETAWDAGCYKVMLLTGRKDEATLQFYKQAGFQRGIKTGLIAVPDDRK